MDFVTQDDLSVDTTITIFDNL